MLGPHYWGVKGMRGLIRGVEKGRESKSSTGGDIPEKTLSK